MDDGEEDFGNGYPDEETENQESYIDEDALYEKYRDDASDALEEDLKEVILKHINKEGYYHNNPEKAKEHAIFAVSRFKK